MNINLKVAFLNLAILSIFLVSCSDKSATGNKPENLAQERWNALIEKNWEKAYSFETPAFRKIYTVENFKNSFGGAVVWKSAKILKEHNKIINNNVIDIKIELTIIFSDNGNDHTIPTVITERWLKIKKTWYHVNNKSK